MPLITENGLDLDFSETKKSLGFPVKGKRKGYSKDPIFDRIGDSFKNMDYQQYLTRFKWNNLPNGIDEKWIEKFLYTEGFCIFFKEWTLNFLKE